MTTEDLRSERYIAAVWRAVAKACQNERMTTEDRECAVRVAELVEQQLRLTAALYKEESGHETTP